MNQPAFHKLLVPNRNMTEVKMKWIVTLIVFTMFTSIALANSCPTKNRAFSSSSVYADPLDSIVGNNQLDENGTQKLRLAIGELMAGSCVYHDMVNDLIQKKVKIDFHYDLSGKRTGGYNPANGSISFAGNHAISLATVREELLHAFQDHFYVGGIGQYLQIGFSNIEFEAKVIVDVVDLFDGVGQCCMPFTGLSSGDTAVDYQSWLVAITKGGTQMPKFWEIEEEYFTWLERFKEANPSYNKPTDPQLTPNAANWLLRRCR